MATPVYVYPMHEISGVFSDLHGGNPLKDGEFNRLATPMRSADGSETNQVSYYWDFETPLVSGGRLKLSRTGGKMSGLVEAERATAMAMMHAVRVEHKLFPADYSFAKIIQMRPVYNTMRLTLDSIKRAYAEMQLSANKIHSAVLALCRSVSVSLGWVNKEIETVETIAISAFHSALSDKAKAMEYGIRHAASLIEMAEKKDKVPEEQKFFDMTVPLYEVVDWQRSYYTMRTVMDNAVKKLPGPVSGVYTDYLQDGSMQARIHIAGDPNKFVGPAANTLAAAKAKLCFKVIDYVHTKLEIPINDLNSVVRVHQDGYIRRFDMKMKCIAGCGIKLQEMVDGIGEMFQRCHAELLPRLQTEGKFDKIHRAIEQFSMKYTEVKAEFYVAKARVDELKADRKEVEELFVSSDSDDE